MHLWFESTVERKLMAAILAGHGMVGEAELYDFGTLAFEPIEVPY